MFWKKDNLSRYQSLSLVTKLMLFYSLSTIGLLAAISLFLYPTFIKMIDQLNGLTITAECCYEKISIALLLSALSAILFGHVIARNGLTRMRQFENKIEQITADSLHERINLNEWPKELKSLGIKFNLMLDRIHTSFIQLSQFSSDIAHELRTPLNNLTVLTEMTLTQRDLSMDCRKNLEKSMDEYHHLSRLIENLLFLARSDHGQVMLKKESISAQTEILKIADYYQAFADEHNIEILCTGDAILFVDLILFKRLISNLLSNALRYTPLGGKIKISIQTEDYISILIEDTGCGISEEHLPNLFNRFYRADSSRTSQSGGLGLGLAIVKSIVHLHKGEIEVVSKMNEGTTFYLKFPQ